MEFTYVVTAILVAIVTYCIYYIMTYNANYWTKRGVTNIKSAPLFGVMWEGLIMKKGMSQLFTDIYNNLSGERFGGYLQFTSPVLILRDLELINRVLVKDFIHFEDRNPPWEDKRNFFAANLFSLTGEEWRTARHKLTPTFTSGKLKNMFESIDKCTNEVILHIDKNRSQDFEGKNFSTRFVLNTIASVAFGLKINTYEEDKDSDFFKNSEKFFKPSIIFLLKLFIATFVPKVRDYFGIRLTNKEVDDYFHKLAKDAIKLRETTGVKRNDFLQMLLDTRDKEREFFNKNQSTISNINTVDNVNEGETDDGDKELLEHLKNTPTGNGSWKYAEEIFTDDFIAAQTFTFIVGGSESTSTVLSFVMYELASAPDCQRRAQQQIDDILSNSNFSYQAVQKMTYLDQCINETLRNKPLGAGLFRICTLDYKIPGTDIIIEKGTFVNIPICALHKDPQYHPEPDKFNPDRFEDMDAIPKGAFINFGSGPRMCIANRLAILEMKMFLAKILMYNDIVLSKKTKLPLTFLKRSAIISPEGGIWVKFVKRQNVKQNLD